MNQENDEKFENFKSSKFEVTHKKSLRSVTISWKMTHTKVQKKLRDLVKMQQKIKTMDPLGFQSKTSLYEIQDLDLRKDKL